MEIRFAVPEDIDTLIKMRWDFTLEYHENINKSEYKSFHEDFYQFLHKAIKSDVWYIWVIEIDNQVVSTIFIELVQKVPRPGRATYPFVYMTNVYTLPEYRGQGIGSKLISTIINWAEEKNYELIIVWPSDEAINFYKKNDFVHCQEAMVNQLH